MQQINVKGATNEVLLESIGAALRARVLKQFKTVSAFSEKTRLSRNTLHKLFRGDVAKTDTLVRVLRALGDVRILESLIEGPVDSPMEKLAQQNAEKGTRKGKKQNIGPDLDKLKTAKGVKLQGNNRG